MINDFCIAVHFHDFHDSFERFHCEFFDSKPKRFAFVWFTVSSSTLLLLYQTNFELIHLFFYKIHFQVWIQTDFCHNCKRFQNDSNLFDSLWVLGVLLLFFKQILNCFITDRFNFYSISISGLNPKWFLFEVSFRVELKGIVHHSEFLTKIISCFFYDFKKF